MAEFVLKSRKNETQTPDFELQKLQKLQKPDAGQSLEFLESKAEGIRLKKRLDTIPPLPWKLEGLLRAANSGQLPQGMQHVHGLGLIFDLGTYTLACAATYLTGDRDAALERLWKVHRAWQGVN